MKILFILKERFYHYNNTHVKSYGLINSSKHIAKYFESLNLNIKVVSVIDGNGIDKEVYNYKPDVVIIEALWVPPSKLKELIELKRYKHIKWIVRIHSDIGFLSVESLALKYINDYIALDKHNLIIAPNNKSFTKYLSNSLNYKFTYLPNIINIGHCNIKHNKHQDLSTINIGCFGSLRILKNQLFQAMCAMKAADILNKKLHFHITADIKDSDKINPVLNNFIELFKNSRHTLIEHKWEENDNFQHLIKKMDIGMQLSYTESFNIVSADFINNDKLILVSDAIDWMPDCLKTSTTNYDIVTDKIVWLYKHRNSWILKKLSIIKLLKFNMLSKKIWLNFLEHLKK
jgi:hypothetical protein